MISIGASNKPTLIDLEAEMANKAEAERHRERLSERAPKGDAIVRTCRNNNCKRLAEMSSPAEKRVTILDTTIRMRQIDAASAIS